MSTHWPHYILNTVFCTILKMWFRIHNYVLMNHNYCCVFDVSGRDELKYLLSYLNDPLLLTFSTWSDALLWTPDAGGGEDHLGALR